MKFKKFILSLATMVLMLNLSPKMHAEIASVDWFEAKIREGGFIRIFDLKLADRCKLKCLKEINSKLQNWEGTDVYKLKSILRELAQGDAYGNIELELSYIALISATVDEALENLRNVESAYQRINDKPDRFPLY